MTKSAVQSNVDILEAMFRSIDLGDIANGMSILADDIVWHEPEGLSIGGTYHGSEAVREVLSSLMGAFEGQSFVPERFVDDGEDVIVFGTFTGTHAETGKSVEIPLVHVWTFEDGRAIEFRRYTDTARLNWAFEA